MGLFAATISMTSLLVVGILIPLLGPALFFMTVKLLGPNKKLLQSRLLGRGIITDIKLTGRTMQMGNGLVQRTCIFTLEVSLDGKAPSTATRKQRIPEVQIPQIQPGSTNGGGSGQPR